MSLLTIYCNVLTGLLVLVKAAVKVAEVLRTYGGVGRARHQYVRHQGGSMRESIVEFLLCNITSISSDRNKVVKYCSGDLGPGSTASCEGETTYRGHPDFVLSHDEVTGTRRQGCQEREDIIWKADSQSAASYVHLLQPPFIGSFISLMILESAHSGFTISFNNSYLIGGFNDPTIFGHMICLRCRDSMVTVEIGFVIILVVNLFFICIQEGLGHFPTCTEELNRQQSFLVIAPYVLALVSMWIGHHSFFGDTWTSFQGKAYALVAASMGASVLGDTLIALTLVYYLHSKHTAR
ncbi:hypothetical protein V8B97DRAFT_1915587 [Scleroderma yunnanense]